MICGGRLDVFHGVFIRHCPNYCSHVVDGSPPLRRARDFLLPDSATNRATSDISFRITAPDDVTVWLATSCFPFIVL